MQDVFVETGPGGRLRGAKDANGVCRFLGVPYALPPINERRWRKPEPLPTDYSYETDGQARDCTNFGNVCPQETYVMDGAPFNYLDGAKACNSHLHRVFA
jgi:carboxylesterase type B